MTFEEIVLVLGGGSLTKAMLTEIRVILGGKKIWTVNGTDLDNINKYYSLTANAAYVPLWFADPSARTLDEYLIGAIDTSTPYDGFSIEVDIAGATTPTLAAYARQSAPISKTKAYAGMMRTIVKATNSPAAAGEFSLPIPIGSRAGALLRAIHFKHSNITQLQVVKDSFYLLEQAGNGILQFMQNERAALHATQSGYISWDPIAEGFDPLAIPTLRNDANRTPASMEFKVTVSGADTVTSYSDMYQTHAGF
jgi:hypothetical protein